MEIIVSVPEDKVEELLQSVRDGKFEELGIVEARLAGPEDLARLDQENEEPDPELRD